MASYFEEHDCRPLEEGETPNHTLHLARLLLDGGIVDILTALFIIISTSGDRSKRIDK